LSRDYSFLLIIGLSLPALIEVDYPYRVYFLYGQLLLVQSFLFYYYRKFLDLNFTHILVYIAALFIIVYSNVAGLLSGRSTLSPADFSDLAPLLVLLLIFKLSRNVVSAILLITNVLAIILNIVKLTLLSNDSLNWLYDAYRISENFDANYWRFTGLAGQAGQTGLHGVLSFLFVFKKGSKMSNLDKWIGLLAVVNVIFSGSRISLVLLVLYVIVVILHELSLVKIVILSLVVSFAYFLSFKSLFGEEIYEQRFTNLETGGYRFKLLSSAFDFALESFPVGFGGQKEFLETHGEIGYSDLSLRNPDSTLALILVRYGFLGFFLILGFVLVKLLMAIINNNIAFLYGALIIFMYALVDPIFTIPLNVFLLGQYFKSFGDVY
jgi:hypothetical protein